MSMEELRRLEAAWARAEPRRAGGGAASLSGFSFQLHSTIAEIVRTWVVDQTSVAPIAEAISDLITLDRDGRMTITQMKRTGRSPTIKAALAELWTIEQVAAEEMPDLLGRLAYEIRCARWQVADARRTIDEWDPADDRPAADLGGFRAKVTVSTDPAPLSDALVLLSSELRDPAPLATIDRWVGLLVRDISLGRPDSADDIYADLSRLRHQGDHLPAGIQIVDARCAEPLTPAPGGYLVGKQPQLRHLAEGWFAPRSWQVTPATEALIEWLAASPDATDDQRRLPCFWIDGRSGCGKSVLLLQVAARMAELGYGPIAYLGNRHHLVGPAFRWAIANAAGSAPLVVVDDPFGAGDPGVTREHWQPAFDALVELRESGAPLPTVVACGPSEQANGFERALPDDVQLRRWAIDEGRDTEREAELETWFRHRSGKAAPSLSGNVLMVQRFFEWQIGEDLGSFAARFRSRVAHLDPTGHLETFVARLLAANRLYAGLPEGTLTELGDETRDALARLEADGHVSLDRGHEGRPGVWLTHPHLADALFNGWYPETAGRERSGALRDAALQCARLGTTPAEQTSVLWAMATVLDRRDPVVATRLDDALLAETVDQIFERWPRQPGGVRTSHLPAWIRVVAGVPGTKAADEVLGAASRIVAGADVDTPGFEMTCLTIVREALRIEPAMRQHLLSQIGSVLDRSPSWSRWDRVACTLATTTKAAADARRILDRVAADPSATSVPRLLAAAGACPDIGSEPDDLGERGAAEAPPTPQWGAYLAGLVERRPGVADLVATWARHHDATFPSGLVTASLLRARRTADDVTLGSSWLERFWDSPWASYMVQALVQQNGLDGGADTVPLALRWLGDHPTDAGASFVVEAIVESGALRDRRTADQVTPWLTRHPEAAGWAFAFQKLLDLDPDERPEGLIPLGSSWLHAHRSDPGWAFVHQRLLAMTTGDQHDELVRLGGDWVEDNGSHASWGYVYLELLEQPGLDQEHLVAIGTDWLDRHRTDAGWSNVHERIVALASGERHEELVRLGIAWLEGGDEQPGWHFEYQRLLDEVTDPTQREDLIATGMDWLDGHEDQIEWNFTFQKLVDTVTDPTRHRALVATGIRWLDDTDRAGWTYVGQKLLATATDLAQHDQVVVAHIRWLRRHGDRPQWGHVLQTALAATTEPGRRVELSTIGAAWLRDHEDHPQWKRTLQTLLETPTDPDSLETLIATGLAWLARNEDHDQWGYVFELLVVHVTDVGVLDGLGARGTAWVEGRPTHRTRPVVSRSLKAVRRTLQASIAAELLPRLEVGDVLDGVVVKTVNFGLFIDIGGINGLVHRSTLPIPDDEKPAVRYSVGDEVKVAVRQIDVAGQRLELTLLAVSRAAPTSR